MKYWIFIGCALVVYFFLGGKEYGQEKKYYPPHGVIIAVGKHNSLKVKMSGGDKLTVDIVDGATNWEVGDAVKVNQLSMEGSYIVNLDTGEKATALVGEY